MLRVTDINAYYGLSHILHGVSLEVGEGEAVSLLGRNGAGKTTTLLTIMGYLKPHPGRIEYRNRSIAALPPYKVSRLGLGYVPQERGIFPSLTVLENLTVAARTGAAKRWTVADIHRIFPVLEERSNNRGFQLSGGEQQMLAIARALLLNPSLLLLDEPSEGLAPIIVKRIFQTLQALKKEGLSILLVEQNMRAAFALADRHYVLSKGQVCFSGKTAQLDGNESVMREYLGI
jgi:branched-chain amino acid transport system ATP-binding protein